MPWSITRRRALRWTLLGIGVITLLGLGGLLYVRSRDSTTPVEVSSAVERFRQSGEAAGIGRASLPRPGVYVYATDGTERVDEIGGATHTYPARTTITISPNDCGVTARWDALHERWDERETCATPTGEVQRSTRQYHEFFGFSDIQAFDCDTVVHPADETEGTTTTGRCSNAESRIAVTTRVIGIETLEVDRTPVETVHIHEQSEITGSTRGSSEEDRWIARGNGLVVRRVVRVDSDADSPIGTAHYHERYTITLTSTSPRR